MNPVTLFLLTISGIFLIGTLGEIVFRRTNVPDAIWLILMGILIGPVTGLVHREQLGSIAPYFAALTLIVVLFEGGSKLKIKEVSREVHFSGFLALLTFGASILTVTLACFLLEPTGLFPSFWNWKYGLLLGVILGGSSSIVIMPAMSQAKVEPEVANLVNLESAFTDALCVVGASTLIELLAKGGSSSPIGALFRSLGMGLALGLAFGALWLFLLRPLKESTHSYPITFSALLILYVLVGKAGGSAALGILAFAVIVGNAGWIGSKLKLSIKISLGEEVRGFHSQMAFIIKSFFFTFIGAMLTLPWSFIGLGLLLGILLLLARVPCAWLIGKSRGLGPSQWKLVAVSMPRGMAAGVLATMPLSAGISGTEPFPAIVFSCVLASILVFAVGFPLVKKKGSSSLSTEPTPPMDKKV